MRIADQRRALLSRDARHVIYIYMGSHVHSCILVSDKHGIGFHPRDESYLVLLNHCRYDRCTSLLRNAKSYCRYREKENAPTSRSVFEILFELYYQLTVDNNVKVKKKKKNMREKHIHKLAVTSNRDSSQRIIARTFVR